MYKMGIEPTCEKKELAITLVAETQQKKRLMANAFKTRQYDDGFCTKNGALSMQALTHT